MKIFVVDDDPDFRGLATRAMAREFGNDAAIQEIADAAALQQHLADGPPDLLVSDLSLKWSDGFQVLADVRQVVPDCVAIMFTGTGNEDLAVRAIKAGFDDYIVKDARQLRRLGTAARAAYERVLLRRNLEDNRDILTAELYHRLHNNLQLVISMLAFTAREIADREAKEKLNDLSQRVRALSLLQERLYRGRDFRNLDFAAFLGQLVDNILALDPRQITVKLNADPVSLPVTVAVPLALIANELITNAMKHAFGQQAGTISISFQMLDTGDHSLVIADNGVGVQMPQPLETPAGGLGLGLVHRLAQQIAGRVEVSQAEKGGSVWRVTVAASAVPSAS